MQKSQIRSEVKKMENKNTIEENFEQLEEILKAMQSEDVTLDKSFELYNQGLKLVQDCNSKIDTIEKKIKIIEEDSVNE